MYIQICVFVAVIILSWLCLWRWRNRKLVRLSKMFESDVPCLPIIGHAYKFAGNDEVQMKAIQDLGREALDKGGILATWMGNFLFLGITDPEVADFVLKNYLEKPFILQFARDVIGNGIIFAPVAIWRRRRKILMPTFNPKNIKEFWPVLAKQSSVLAEHLSFKVGTGPFSIWKYFTAYTMDVICDNINTNISKDESTSEAVRRFRNSDARVCWVVGPCNPHEKKKKDKTPLPAPLVAVSAASSSVAVPFKTTMGIQLDVLTNQDHPFIRLFEIGSNLVATRMFSPWFYSDFIYRLTPAYRTLMYGKQFLSDFIGEIIKTKRKDIEIRSKNIESSDKDVSKKYTYKSFLELLIKSSGGLKGYTDEELQEEVQVLVMAGNDTSAVALGFISLMLARYPKVQERAYQEIQEVFENSSRVITPEDLTRIKYLEAVIKETLRLYPPAAILPRYCDRDLTLPSGITMVEGTNLIVNIWALHRNPKYWGPDAEEFRPERWLEMETLQHPAQYIAFSYGPRNCAGNQFAMMSMKTVICSLLRRYRVLPDCEPTAVNGQVEHKPIRLRFDIMMKDVEDYIVRLENRV